LKRSYHTITTKGPTSARRLAEFFSRNGQGLLPMVDLIEQSRLAVDELIDVAGRATIEAVLQLSAEQLAGPRTPGQRRPQLLWHPAYALADSTAFAPAPALSCDPDGGGTKPSRRRRLRAHTASC
jgi:hypothetical protein